MLELKGKKVLPPSEIQSTLEKIVKSGKAPLTRDSLYAYLQKQYVNIRRAPVDNFLRSQSWITDTSNRKAEKKSSWSIKKKGVLEYDTTPVKWKDLGFEPIDKHLVFVSDKKKIAYDDDKFPLENILNSYKTQGHLFTAVDSYSGLTYIKYTTTLKRFHTNPISKHCFKWFAKKLNMKVKDFTGVSDHGVEFDFELFKKWGMKIRLVPRGGRIEQKNAHIQRVLYRIAKLGKTKSIHELVEMVQENINNSPTKNKQTPNEIAAGEKQGKPLKLDTSKQRYVKLKFGDKVRVDITDHKKEMGYKGYKGSWSREVYTVKSKNSKTYFTLSDGSRHHVSRLNKVTSSDKTPVTEKPKPKPKPKPKIAKKKFKSIDVSEENIVRGKRKRKKRKFYGQ